MRKFIMIAVAVFTLMIVGGAIVLASWTIPAPTARIEKPIPDEKLAK